MYAEQVLAENRCENFKQLNRPVADWSSSGQWCYGWPKHSFQIYVFNMDQTEQIHIQAQKYYNT
jgi:hypothetical protein